MPQGQQRILLLLLAVGCVLQIVMLLGTSIPLGVPGEWTWSRLPQGSVNYFNLVFTVFIFLLYYLFLRWGASKIQRCSSLHKTALLVMLSLASMTVLWNLKAVPGNIFGHSGMTWVTYYPRMSGYFTQAVSGEQTTQEFLASYEQAAAEGDYLHQGTHPPGLILYFRFMHNLCGSSPALTQLLLASETEDVSAGLDVLEELSAGRDQAFTQDQRATLWLSILITFLVCAATVVPVFFILVRFTSANIAFALSGLWPLVPALALFAPKSDLFLAFISAWLATLWIQAVTSKKLLPGLFAGGVLWLGMMTSLAIIVVPVILLTWTLLLLWRNQSSDVVASGQNSFWGNYFKSIPVLPLVAIFTGLLLPCLLMWGLFDLNLFSVWLINLSKHAEFYDHNSRTFILWLLVNPLEMAFSLGMPLFVLTFFAVYKAIVNRLRFPGSGCDIAVVMVWLLLLVSGKNMGEAARLWIFLLPLLLCVAGHGWVQSSEDQAQAEEPLPRFYTALFIAQAAVALATLSAIDAFDFTAI